MDGHLIELFRSRAAATASEVRVFSNKWEALVEATSLLKEEQRLEVTADERLTALLRNSEAKDFRLVFPERAADFALLKASLVEADYGVAETGTLVHLDDRPEDRWRWTLPEVCLTFLSRERIVRSVDELLQVFNSYLFSSESNLTPEGETGEESLGQPEEETQETPGDEEPGSSVPPLRFPPKQISFVSGPRSMASVDGQLELGVHGPQRLIIFIY